MSDADLPSYLHFVGTQGPIKINIDRDVLGIINDWDGLRVSMSRNLPEGFTRDEWAYLISFIDSNALHQVYSSTFGELSKTPLSDSTSLQPCGNVVLWSPNNVSLLAPLTLILVSITGNRLRVKLGTNGADLCTPLIDWIREHIRPGPLLDWLSEDLTISRFSREDPRNSEWSKWANVRIVFGSDEGCAAVSSLPSADVCRTFLFSNKTSQMWCTLEEMDQLQIDTLIKVFSIYGTAGCTSPRIVNILDGSKEDRLTLVERIALRWPSIVRGDVEMHNASQNILSAQTARARGWETILLERNSAVIALGDSELEMPDGLFTMVVTSNPVDRAITELPQEIQTIGYALPQRLLLQIEDLIDETPVKRFVPVNEMHHFGPIWDGMNYWKGMFVEA